MKRHDKKEILLPRLFASKPVYCSVELENMDEIDGIHPIPGMSPDTAAVVRRMENPLTFLRPGAPRVAACCIPSRPGAGMRFRPRRIFARLRPIHCPKVTRRSYLETAPSHNSSHATSGQRIQNGVRVLLFVFLLTAPGASGLTVLYTASLNGNLDGCTCRDHPRAGLATRAAWLRALPERDTTVLVDAGNILSGIGDKVQSRDILETYAELGYDAVAVGGREIAEGVDALTGYRDRFGLICQNLTLCTSSHCLLFAPQPLLLEKEEAKVGLFALLDPKALATYPKDTIRDVKLVPPDVLVGSLVSQLVSQGAEWIIMLYHGPVKEAEALARNTTGIHVIIVGGEQKLIPPRKVGDAFIVSPGEEGNRVGILELGRDRRGRVRYTHRFRLFKHGAGPDDP